MLVIEIHGGSALFSGQKIWKSKKSIGQRTFVSEGLVSYNSPKINVVTWVVGIPNVNFGGYQCACPVLRCFLHTI